MSHERTYIGPFGRVLPLLEGHEEPERVLGPVDETRSVSMAMYTLPRPALEFGSDTRGFTDPLRYSSQRSAPPLAKGYDRNSPPQEQARAVVHDLPGVRQLLTPATHSSVGPTPSPARQSPKEQSSHSFRQNRRADTPRQDTGHAYLDSYQPSQQPGVPQFLPNASPQEDRYAENLPLPPPPPPLPPTQAYMPPAAPIPASYLAYPGQTHQAMYLPQGQPQPIAPIGYPQLQRPQDATMNVIPLPQQGFHQAAPIEYYLDSPGNYGVSTQPAEGPDQSSKSTENPVKLQPRVVREDDLPGEGPVWVYEDGSTCPKVIDGEPVNAEWGITKAGKPRKRLAIACTTCREKKIKCQPALPKCAQCDKFGRECHYATAPRIQQITSESPSYEFQARYKPVKIKTESYNDQAQLPSIIKSPQNEYKHLVKERNPSTEQNTPECNVQPLFCKPPFKKQRSCQLSKTTDEDRRGKPTKERTETTTVPTVKASWEEHLLKVSITRYDWATNPHSIDPQATKHYMEMFFVHGNAAVHHLFPRNATFHWLESGDDKSRNDMMLVYAMLALGALFSARPDHTIHSELFVEVAQYAVENNQNNYTLQLVQSRLLLGLYHFATGQSQSGWDFTGQGFRAASGLNLNTEEYCRDVGGNEDRVFGLQRHSLIECRRRTYWLAYIVDRLGEFHSVHLPMLLSEDTFLRLPCDDDTYSRQSPSNAPFFTEKTRQANADQLYRPIALGPMAYLVMISAIWGDLLTYTYRHSRELVGILASNYEKHYREISRRLFDWKTSLPKDLEYTTLNVSSSIENGAIGMFLEMHTIYHATIMRLNRNLPNIAIPPLSRCRNFTKARKQALELLNMTETIVSASRSSKNALDTSGNFPEFSEETLEACSPLAGSTPFAGYTVLIAVDILSAGGSMDPKPFKSLIQTMTTGLAIVDELSQCWASAVVEKKVILRRLENLFKSAYSDAATVKKVWRCRRALDTAVQGGHDIFYPDPDSVSDDFFHKLEVAVEEHEVLYID